MREVGRLGLVVVAASLIVLQIGGPAMAALVAWRFDTVDDDAVDSFSPTTMIFRNGHPEFYYSADGLTTKASATWLATPSFGGYSRLLLMEKTQARDALADGDGRLHLFFHKSGDGFWHGQLDASFSAAPIDPKFAITLDAAASQTPSGELFVASVDGSGLVKFHWASRPFSHWSTEIISSNGGQTVALSLDGEMRIHVLYSRIGDLVGHSIKGPTGWTHGFVPNCSRDVGASADDNGTIHVVCHNSSGLIHGRYNGDQWTMTQVDNRGNRYGWEADVDVDSTGVPHIVYNSLFDPEFPDRPATWATPYYATLDGDEWKVGIIDHTASGNGFSPSITVDDRGLPHVSYVTAWTSQTIPGSTGTIDASYDLRYARPVLADLP